MKDRIMALLAGILVSATLMAQQESDTILPVLKNFDDYRVYLQKNISYPRQFAEKGILGKVHFSFYVSPAGCIDSIRIISSPDVMLSLEVTRVLKETSCNWLPGSIRGEARSMQMSCSIEFSPAGKKDEP